MGRDAWSRRAVGVVAAFVCLGHTNAQHDPAAAGSTTASTTTTAEQKRGAATAPTHAPQPALPPLVAWQHVVAGNRAVRAALAAQQALPAPAERPAGAGRHVCAVLVCADADVDVAPLLGLRRADVLVIAAPGPFVGPDAVALLERAVAEQRLSLVLVLGHADCRTLRDGPADVLSRRLAAVRGEAERRGAPVPQTLVQLQRQHLLAASELLQTRTTGGTLRVLPAVLTPATAALTWHHDPIDVLPLAPVR